LKDSEMAVALRAGSHQGVTLHAMRRISGRLFNVVSAGPVTPSRALPEATFGSSNAYLRRSIACSPSIALPPSQPTW